MHPIATWILITALTLPGTTLVLRDGTRIDVDGAIHQENGTVLFRSNGRLYSMPLREVDVEQTKASLAPAPAFPALSLEIPVVQAEKPDLPAAPKLKVSDQEKDRLLRELEQNHSGTAASSEQRTITVFATRELPGPNSDEWRWRNESRDYQERVRRAQEELDLLTTKAQNLRNQIAGFLSIGFKPSQFTYQSTELQYTLEQIPHAQLEVDRAQRAWDQFRDDARRMGILPGWLR